MIIGTILIDLMILEGVKYVSGLVVRKARLLHVNAKLMQVQKKVVTFTEVVDFIIRH